MTPMIDLRSDTITKPSPAMRAAMMDAEVGDDVFGEDPTVNRLQERVALLFGKEAALFVPSGTMGNEICIKVHTSPGDEIIAEEDAHIVIYETAGPAFLAGVQIKTVRGDRGMPSLSDIERAVRPATYYLPKTTLCCLENTHGRSGGAILPLNAIRTIAERLRSRGIRMHCDGARIWNAAVASGVLLKDYAESFDTLSVCFSKGLGAPVGSMIVGDRQSVASALRYRKIFGGGMRQAGILAAAALYALDHNIERLKDDHRKARYFAGELSKIKQLSIDMAAVQTNMVITDISGTGKSQGEILSLFKSAGVLLTPERDSSVRAVMHLDVSDDEVHDAAARILRIFGA
jgi:threonine aldolase